MNRAPGFICGFAAGYLLPGTLRLPVLTYDPVAHSFAVLATVPPNLMRYYGDLLWALAGGAVCALLWRSKTSREVAAATALSVIGLDLLFYLSRLLAAL